MHTFYHPTTTDYGYEFTSTFHSDFDIADHFGVDAVEDTFKRAVAEWKDDIVMMAELCIVTNHRLWFWYSNSKNNKKADQLARTYDKLYKTVNNLVYAEGAYSQEDLNKYFELTD